MRLVASNPDAQAKGEKTEKGDDKDGTEKVQVYGVPV
jgi:hypothetical protein